MATRNAIIHETAALFAAEKTRIYRLKIGLEMQIAARTIPPAASDTLAD